jgi:hypothetical protein
MSLVTATFASRAPVDHADDADTVALVDVLEATLVAAQAVGPVQAPRVISELPATADLAPPSPDVGRVFRPPRGSLS